MRVFVVNLDQDVAKWNNVHTRLTDLGIVHERFSAVYGRAMSIRKKRESLNQFRWWCAIGRRCEDGELGCALSHIAIYNKLVKEKIPVACVFEDDVVLDPRIQEQLRRIESFINVDVPRVVMLSSRRPISRNEWSLEPIAGDFGTFAYAINLAGAKSVLLANFPVQRPADHWAWWRAHGRIELYRAIPIVCDYNRSWDSRTAPTQSVKDFPLQKWLLHKILRIIGKGIDNILG